MKKLLSDMGVYVSHEVTEKLSNSIYMNQHRPLYVIFSSHASTKYVLLQVKINPISVSNLKNLYIQ
jgi:hypothetical protein